MVFSSILFLVFFLPALLLFYYLVPVRFRLARNLVLLAFSLLFYSCGGTDYLPLLLLSIGVNYGCGLLAGGCRGQAFRRAGLWVAVCYGLGSLVWFKYAGFFAVNLNALGLVVPVPQVVLPIGISFYTFQGLSYVIDVYRKEVDCQRNPLYVGLYIVLFPQLIAGPIVRYSTIAEEIAHRRESLEEFSDGIVRFLVGLGKKMLLANAMGEIADQVFAMEPSAMSAPLAWVGALAYTFQIYFDFSAYSDMAIGLGHMFGFRFLENFQYPYVAKSVTEFWRRWHISLSTWFRDYIYIPLGGSRTSKGRNLLNLAVVWLLTGLWHGAAWTFVLWGVWFLALLCGEKYLWGNALKRCPSLVGHAYTMLAVIFSWVLFRGESLPYVGGYLGAMFGLGGTASGGQAAYYLLEYWPEWIACLIACLPVNNWIYAKLAQGETGWPGFARQWLPKLAALCLLALSYMKLAAGSFNPFIYFQF